MLLWLPRQLNEPRRRWKDSSENTLPANSIFTGVRLGVWVEQRDTNLPLTSRGFDYMLLGGMTQFSRHTRRCPQDASFDFRIGGAMACRE